MKHLPCVLIAFRFLLAPIILALAYLYGNSLSAAIFALIVLGFLSDIFDGIIARKLNVSTPKLRRFDSQVDTVFWLAIAYVSYMLYPTVVLENKWKIGLVLLMETSCYALSFIRFKKEISTHHYLAKFFAITMFVALSQLILFGKTGILFNFCILAGILSYSDCLLIISILPRWINDVPSAYHAVQIRKGKVIKRHAIFNG